MKVYRRIRDLREDADLSQEKLAELLCCHQTTYSQYERGVRAIPLDVFEFLADYYNTSTDYLLERTDVVTPYPKKK
ncbi:MAG: helix-turn-helix domain-containing protein [Oscillospiraceae bacterium]|nr:helix-turn-helix domain-containing protein [Oscillospiraceae bacterium]